MQLLTPSGYKDIADVNIGDELCAFDAITSEPIINTLLKKELWHPDMDGDVEGFFENHGIFRSYLINGTYKLFKNQGVWTYLNGEMFVNVAKSLKVGDIIFSDEDQDIEITSIEEIFEPTWWRLEVSGDRTYIADGLTLHNASRYWVNTGTNTNWNSSPTTNWSATSGGVTKAAVPTSTDDVTFDGAGAGNSASVISATITILSFTVTSGYTNTITHNAVLTVAGNVTLNTSYTIAGSSSMTISATSTITSNGKTWPNAMTFTGTNTKTLSGSLVVSGTLTISGTTTLNKTTTETISVAGLTVSFNLSGTADLILTGGTWSGASLNSLNKITLAGDVTISGTILYTGTGTIEYSSGTITTTSSTLDLRNSCTLNTNGVTWNNVTTINDGGSKTYTITSLLSASQITLATNITFAGTSGFYCSTLSCTYVAAGTVSLKESVTYTVTSSIVANSSRVGSILLFTSAHASTKAILTLVNGATCACLASFTRIDASNGRPIRSFNGTITDCNNVVSFFDLLTVAS